MYSEQWSPAKRWLLCVVYIVRFIQFYRVCSGWVLRWLGEYCFSLAFVVCCCCLLLFVVIVVAVVHSGYKKKISSKCTVAHTIISPVFWLCRKRVHMEKKTESSSWRLRCVFYTIYLYIHFFFFFPFFFFLLPSLSPSPSSFHRLIKTHRLLNHTGQDQP